MNITVLVTNIMEDALVEIKPPSEVFDKETLINLLVLFVRINEAESRVLKDISLTETWLRLASLFETLAAELKLSNQLSDEFLESVNFIELTGDRINYLAPEVKKLIKILENYQNPVLLQTFPVGKKQLMQVSADETQLSFLILDIELEFPQYDSETLVTILSPNPNKVTDDLDPYVVIDYQGSQILPDSNNPEFIRFIRANCEKNLVMFNICLSNSISNFHAQVMQGTKPLSLAEIKAKYQDQELLTYDINDDQGYKQFLDTWRLFNFKQVASSAVVTSDGHAVIFTQQFDNQFITKSVEGLELNSDEYTPEQAKQVLIRILASLVKPGGYEIFLWLQGRKIINKSVLAPEGVLTKEMIILYFQYMVKPLTKKDLDSIRALQSRDVLELVDIGKYQDIDPQPFLKDLIVRQTRYKSQYTNLAT
jgi:hypothetical protein